jgi:hypothetical protein
MLNGYARILTCTVLVGKFPKIPALIHRWGHLVRSLRTCAVPCCPQVHLGNLPQYMAPRSFMAITEPAFVGVVRDGVVSRSVGVYCIYWTTGTARHRTGVIDTT